MTTVMAPIYLMQGFTTHSRVEGLRHSFRYRVTLIDVDTDRLAEADKQTRLFSVNRPNLMSLNTARRGDSRQPLSLWARGKFKEAGVDPDKGHIRLITFPSVTLYSFAPLSIWLLIGPNDEVKGVIYEVNNTFGERHSYVGGVNACSEPHETDKLFHVSPFFDVSGTYRFHLQNNDRQLLLKIENFRNGELSHTALLSLQRRALNTGAVVRHLVMSPFSGIGVTMAIHWEALKLFLKGARYHSRPAASEKSHSFITSSSSNSSGK